MFQARAELEPLPPISPQIEVYQAGAVPNDAYLTHAWIFNNPDWQAPQLDPVTAPVQNVSHILRPTHQPRSLRADWVWPIWISPTHPFNIKPAAALDTTLFMTLFGSSMLAGSASANFLNRSSFEGVPNPALFQLEPTFCYNHSTWPKQRRPSPALLNHLA